MPALTAEQKNDLLAAMEADLTELVQSPTTEGLKRSLGFISLCKRMGFSTVNYREERASDEEFAKACNALEQDLNDILGEMTFGTTLKDGKPKDQLALAERVNSETFGKKAEEKKIRIEAIFQQLPAERLAAHVLELDSSLVQIIDSTKAYGADNIKGLLND